MHTSPITSDSRETYAIFSANYLPNIGGVEKYTQNLALELAEQGNKVIIITNNVFDLENCDKEDEHEHIDIVRLPCHNMMNGRYPLPHRNKKFRGLMQWLIRQPVDHAIINTRFYFHSLIGIHYAEEKGIKPIIIDHGSAHLTIGNPVVDIFIAVFEHVFTNIVKRHEADYYAVSEAGARWLEHFNINAKGTLCNSIDAECFRNNASNRDFRQNLGISSNDFLVSFTGRFIPEKGIRPLMDAAEMLLANTNIHFALAGEGPLEQEITDKKLSNVHNLGKLSSPDVAALLLTSNAFCLPTRSEGFSTSLLEAAACGAVPIVTSVGGVEELMPTNEYGVLLSQASGAEIKEAVLNLSNNIVECNRMAHRIKSRVRNEFSWQSTTHKVIAACSQANDG